jgi:phosphoglycerate dehydrogenase-like enzyme
MGHTLPLKIAILDDYQNIALREADWSPLAAHAEITVFTDHFFEVDAIAQRLAPFDVVCAMRERTPFSRELIAKLPNLKLIASTGAANAAIDLDAAAEHGIEVRHTGYSSTPTIAKTNRCETAAGRCRSAPSWRVKRWGCWGLGEWGPRWA